ncbi:MAG: ATP-binding protein, partial [Bacteroidota bacterium]
INTPMQYVGDNTQFLMDALQDVFETNNALQKVLTLAKEHGQYPELIAEVENLLEEADITYLAEEIPASLHQTLEGVNQVSRLVKAMREFSQPVIAEKTMVDVNSALENTLTVTENEWGFVADLRRDMACELPHILGYPAELNQAFYHLITNAAHAVAEAMEEAGGEKGDITISTATEDNWCVVRIGDNGTGIPEAIRPRIFDPFFTTKSDGLGVGQGLSVVHAVVVEKHGGRISIDSMAGVGTTVTVRLPLVPEKQLLHTLH